MNCNCKMTTHEPGCHVGGSLNIDVFCNDCGLPRSKESSVRFRADAGAGASLCNDCALDRARGATRTPPPPSRECKMHRGAPIRWCGDAWRCLWCPVPDVCRVVEIDNSVYRVLVLPDALLPNTPHLIFVRRSVATEPLTLCAYEGQWFELVGHNNSMIVCSEAEAMTGDCMVIFTRTASRRGWTSTMLRGMWNTSKEYRRRDDGRTGSDDERRASATGEPGQPPAQAAP